MELWPLHDYLRQAVGAMVVESRHDDVWTILYNSSRFNTYGVEFTSCFITEHIPYPNIVKSDGGSFVFENPCSLLPFVKYSLEKQQRLQDRTLSSGAHAIKNYGRVCLGTVLPCLRASSEACSLGFQLPHKSKGGQVCNGCLAFLSR